MNNEYIIVNKTAIEKRIEELEKEKIKFAIEILADLHDEMDYPYTDMITLRIEELEQQLSEL